ncbi:unnamed protein product [Cunninghamella blakesleeana]
MDRNNKESFTITNNNIPREDSVQTITVPINDTDNISHNTISDEAENEKKQLNLPKEGLFHNPKGWLVVLATFLVNFFCFGVVFAWGNYQQLYLEVYAGKTDTFRIAFVITLASAILLSSGIFFTPIIQFLGYRGTMVFGAFLAPLGVILSSFATELWHLYLTQGMLFGIGCGLVFAPSLALPSQWFTKNRSFATGLAVSGSGIGGLAISPMSENLIASIGYRNALRVIGAMGFGILMIATSLAYSKYLPGGVQRGKVTKIVIVDTSIISRDFILLCCYCFFIPFGYLGPFFLTPQYVTFLGGDRSQGATLVSIMSAMNSVCRIIMGFIADRLGKFNTMALCTFLSGLFSMVIWQFSTDINTYIAFCIVYGLMAGVFVSLLPIVIAEIVGVENIQCGIGMTYTITLFGNLLGSPLIGLLKDKYGWTIAIQFAGAPTILSGIILLYLRFLRSNGKVFMVI